MSAELFSCCIQGDKHPVYRVQTLRFACSFTTQKNFTRDTFTSRYCAQCFLALARSQYIRTGVLSISSPSLVNCAQYRPNESEGVLRLASRTYSSFALGRNTFALVCSVFPRLRSSKKAPEALISIYTAKETERE